MVSSFVALASRQFRLFPSISAILSDTDQSLVIAITLMVALLCVCMIVGHLLEENKWMNESITALILGLCTGVILLVSTNGTNSMLLEFDEELFFIYLLPPIIFNAGFQVKKKHFFENFVAIVLYGVVGVLISFAIIGGGCRLLFPLLNVEGLEIRDYMALGVIFSATDSVCTLQVLSQDETPLLYSLVFGEGVVNDATSIVLFRAVQNIDLTDLDIFTILEVLGEFIYLYLSSTVMGIVVGLASAYIIKKLYFGRHSTDREIAIMILMAYFSYMIAELLYLSGIFTVFFCGIVMSHYTWHNVTESSKITTRHTFATLSFIAETFIFLYVGMDVLDKDKWSRTDVSAATSAGISATLMLVVLLGRAAFVFPLSALSNLLRPATRPKINVRHQVIIWWSGLMRGAVSIALAYNKFTGTSSINATMITSTIIVVLFSTVVFGLLTKPLVKWIVPMHESSDPFTPKDSFSSDIQVPFIVHDESATMTTTETRNSIWAFFRIPTIGSVHRVWRKFDNSYMRPVFGGRGFVPHLPRVVTGETSLEGSHEVEEN